MEAVLREIRRSRPSTAGDITYEKLELVGVAEEADLILQRWVDIANGKKAGLNPHPMVFQGALAGVLRESLEHAANEIGNLYFSTVMALREADVKRRTDLARTEASKAAPK
jgi:5-formaminoimidazole-4-carboxamide-1-beta-D-ribofuranosyl 5'-monophosphate synthetase